MSKLCGARGLLVLFLLGGCVSNRGGVDDGPLTPADEAVIAGIINAPVPEVPEAVDLGEAVPVNTLTTGSRLEIYLFDLGQADSMLVVGPEPDRKTMLIDLGTPTASSELPAGFTSSDDVVRQRIRAITGRSRVDYFVLTHYHSDHVGTTSAGMIRLLSDFPTPFRVGEFIHVQDDGAEFMAPSRRTFETVRRLIGTWESRGRIGASTRPSFGTSQIDLGSGVSVDILGFAGRAPGGGSSAFTRAQNASPRHADYADKPGDENDLSIAMEITAGDFEMFTAGDLNGTDDPVRHPLFVERSFGGTFTNIEHHLVNQWQSSGRETDVEIYRADHHGSAFSTTARLLDALDPEVVLYSSGADKSGHPTSRVMRDVARTATQLATTAVANASTFASLAGRVVGEIRIVVAADGRSYAINGTSHRAFTDSQEAVGQDR
jgi:Metallo-beta-lactamase superfamily